MNTFTKLASVLVLSVSATAAQASTTIDFTNANPGKVTGTYTEDGFNLDGESGSLRIVDVKDDTYRGSQAINSDGSAFSLSLTKDGGGLFDVVSFDVASGEDKYLFSGPDLAAVPLFVDVIWTGVFADDTTDTFQFSGTISGFQTVNFGSTFEDIKELTWQTEIATFKVGGADIGDPLFAQYDNIVINSDTVVTPPITPGVPEPSTWLLMLAGFAVTGFSLKRRNTLAASAA